MAAAGDDYGGQSQTSSVASTDGGNDLFMRNYTDGLAKFVAGKQLPFGFADCFYFEDFAKSLNPLAKRVPRAVLARRTRILYRKGKEELIRLFGNGNNKFSICCDIWYVPGHDFSYVSIACHWVDDSWKMQKRLLAFRVFEEEHTAENLSRLISSILEEYNLKDRVFSFSMNNVSSNAICLKDFKHACESSIGGLFLHVVCVCHVLNVLVHDILSHLHNHIEPIRQAVQYLSDTQVMKQFANFCKINGMKPRKFFYFIRSFWESTHYLFHQSIPYKELLCSFFMQNASPVHVSDDQWAICVKIFDILKTFNDATVELSRGCRPTSHLVLLNYCDVAGVLKEYSDDEILKDCVEVMRSKWKKYFSEIPEITLIACVLDPRIKLDGLQDLLKTYYDALFPDKDVDSHDAATIVENIKIQLFNLYNEYHLRFGRVSIENQDASSRDSNINSTHSKRPLSARERWKRYIASSSGQHELENYLSLSFEFSETEFEEAFDILLWWSQRRVRFPILSLMAKEVLACPASTVDIKEIFYVRGNILSKNRPVMHPNSLEAQECLGDWERAKYGSQDILPELTGEDSDIDTEETTTTGDSDESD